ncbi:ESPR domain-containing protein, partial [Escherichia coli]
MAFNALLFMQSWFYLDVLLEIVMNKIYRLKWNRSRNCWSVCSELGSRVKGKKSRAVLISAISLYSSLVFADDVIVNQDKTGFAPIFPDTCYHL